MIESFELSNYEGHLDSKFEFKPGLNLIHGLSDHGKSAILRALYLVANNKPNGTPYINHDSKETTVILETNGHKIERKRSEKINHYKIDQEKALVGFGQTVPESVSKIIEFDEINIQDQLTPHFLLSSTPGEVAKILNRIIRLDDIDRALKNIESMKRKFKKAGDHAGQNEKDFTDQLESLSWVAEAETRVLILEEKNLLFEKRIRDKSVIESAVNSFKDLEQRIKVQIEILKKESVIKALSDKIEALSGLNQKNIAVFQLISSLSDIDKKIRNKKEIIGLEPRLNDFEKKVLASNEKSEKFKTLNGLITSLEVIDKRVLELSKKAVSLDRIEALTKKVSDLEKQTGNYNKLYELKSEFISIDTGIHRAEKRIEIYTAKLNRIDLCPTCGQSWPGHKTK